METRIFVKLRYRDGYFDNTAVIRAVAMDSITINGQEYPLSFSSTRYYYWDQDENLDEKIQGLIVHVQNSLSEDIQKLKAFVSKVLKEGWEIEVEEEEDC